MSRNKLGVVFVAAGPGSRALVPFQFEGKVYNVPGTFLRHYKSDCAVLGEAREHGGWSDRVQNNPELRVKTVRCGTCWASYEANEARKAATGDEDAALDHRIDAHERRAAFVRRIESGTVSGAHVVGGA